MKINLICPSLFKSEIAVYIYTELNAVTTRI